MRRALVLCLIALAAVAVTAGGDAHPGTTSFAGGAADTLTTAPAHAARPAAATRAATWCGTTSTAYRPPTTTGYPIRVLYLYPADGVDHSATAAADIQSWIDEIDGWWQREDPSRLPRFDFYNASCGPQVDLVVRQIPSLSVAMTDGQQVFQDVWTALQSDADAGTTKYLAFVDDIDTGDLCGVGGPASGATLGAPAMGLATVLLASCNGASRASVAAHELLHAVNPGTELTGAPHLCPGQAWHVCDSSGDVLYPYVEGGIPLESLQLDVNHDDYWAGTAPVNLQVQPWFRHTQDQVHLALAIAGNGSVTSDIPGVDCSASCGTDWDRGTVVSLSPAAATGFKFVRWSGGCTGDADCSLTLDGAKTVTALFAPETYPLAVRVTGSGTVTSNPRGIACKRGTCTKAFSSYEPVFLTEKAAKGWRFTGWSGGCRGTKARCSVAMTAAASVRATFAKSKKR